MASVFSQTSSEDSVKTCFMNYRSAILNDKGDDAVQYLDSRTVAYYDYILAQTITADSSKLATFSTMDKLMVLMIRHRIDTTTIFSLDGKELIVLAIQMGMIGKNSVINNSVAEVKIDQNFARGQLAVNGKPQSVYFHFYREEKQWKIDLTSIFPLGETAFNNVIAESKLSNDDFIFDLLTRLTGIKPDGKIWLPLKN